METLDAGPSSENALDRKAAFGPEDDAVDFSTGADVDPLDFIYASFCDYLAIGAFKVGLSLKLAI